MSEWRNISTAPKDGTSVLCYDPLSRRNDPDAVGRICTMRWDGKVWRVDIHSFVSFDPTHWQPLPEPPPRAGMGSEM